MNTNQSGPRIPKALGDMSRRELRRFGAMYAGRDAMIRSAANSGVGVNEIARLTGLAKTTVLRSLAAEQRAYPDDYCLETAGANGACTERPGHDQPHRDASGHEFTAPGPLVIIGCGAAKLDHAAPAGQLYTGQHFRACLAAALAIAPRDSVLILSARFGLVGLDDQTAPYDLTIGQPGAVTADQVAAQAAERGQLDRPVIALCGARYADLVKVVWPQTTTPLAGLGIGRQRHALAAMRGNRGESICR